MSHSIRALTDAELVAELQEVSRRVRCLRWGVTPSDTEWLYDRLRAVADAVAARLPNQPVRGADTVEFDVSGNPVEPGDR